MLVLTVGTAFFQWKRKGDDPELIDSPSVLMAGPPADMTPPLATVLREGRATGDAIRTILVQLAGSGLIRFRNLDRVSEVKRDDDPDPATDPAIDLLDLPTDQDPPSGPLGEAYRELVVRGGSSRTLSRSSLWGVNEGLEPIKRQLEQDAVRLGWLTRLPTPVITRWVVVGSGEILLGVLSGFLGFTIPMSGLTIVGVALVAGGLVTIGFGTQMSKRTPNGAYVDAMLKAHRRTLEKTLEQARSMAEVVREPTVAVLADTPDKAVVWGVALGLHREVGEVLARELADPQLRQAAASSGAYYPYWIGSSSTSGGFDAGAGGSLFSGSGVPDFGGMMSALGSVGSTPASSRVALTDATKSGCWTSRAETLTHSDVPIGMRPARCQLPACWHASRRTQEPIGRMAPFSSAISMNSPGVMRPRSGCCQRTRASRPTTRLVPSSMIG